MSNQAYENLDVESGARPLHLMILESLELRWSFKRKVYSIVIIQWLTTIVVGAVIFTVRPISTFFTTTRVGFALLFVHVFFPLVTLFSLYYYRHKYPINYLMLGIFTLSMSFVLGLFSCSFTRGSCLGLEIEKVLLTGVAAIAQILCPLWAPRRGQYFNFLGPFLFGAVLVLVVFEMILLSFPLGKLVVMMYGCIAAIIFCGYIVYELIKRFSHDEYIWASINLYLDIVNLFASLVTILSRLLEIVVFFGGTYFFSVGTYGLKQRARLDRLIWASLLL